MLYCISLHKRLYKENANYFVFKDLVPTSYLTSIDNQNDFPN